MDSQVEHAIRRYVRWRFTPGAWERLTEQQKRARADWAISEAGLTGGTNAPDSPPKEAAS